MKKQALGPKRWKPVDIYGGVETPYRGDSIVKELSGQVSKFLNRFKIKPNEMKLLSTEKTRHSNWDVTEIAHLLVFTNKRLRDNY